MTADQAFSLYIRTRDKWTCQICLATPGKFHLHNSHYHSRKKESTRFDVENCDALCFNCHRRVEQDRNFYTVWKRSRIGEANFEAMATRSASIQKRDRRQALKDSLQLLSELGVK